MKFDKTIILLAWDGEPVKDRGGRELTLGNAISFAIANQNPQNEFFDAYKSYALIDKIKNADKDVDFGDKADFDKLLDLINADMSLNPNGHWVRGQVIDLLKKEDATPKNKAASVGTTKPEEIK